MPRSSSASTRLAARASRSPRAALLGVLLSAAATPAVAQGPAVGTGAPLARAGAPAGFELRPFVGAFIPTGDQRDLLKDAVFTGAQLGYGLTPNLALTGSVGWTPSKDRTGAPGFTGAPGARLGEQQLDVFQYDLAVEGRLPGALQFGTARPWQVSPFAALGAGARTYNYRDLDGASSQTHFVGLGALGVHVGPTNGRVGLRLEARDYVSAFNGLRGELPERKARNDLSFAAGLTIDFGRR